MRERSGPELPELPDPSGLARAPEPQARSLGRRIAGTLALLVVVATLLSAGVLAIHVRVTAALEDTRADGLAAREALGLALAVREHYLHETHTVIQADHGQVAHHHHWIDDIERRVAELSPKIPDPERARLMELGETSRAIDRLYRTRLLPAALAGDTATVRAHQQNSERLLRAATEAADAIVEALDRRAEVTRTKALELSRLAIAVTVLGVVALGLLAVISAVRLRRAVLTPLARLSSAARRFGAGEFDFRVGQAGLDSIELQTLGAALDHMAVELQARERQLVRTERVAAIGQLTAGIAHELNNPIGVIRGYLETMIPTIDANAQPELVEELHILDEEAAACQRIVDDLLSYAREPVLVREPIAVTRLFDAAVRRFATREAQGRDAQGRDAQDQTGAIELDVDEAILDVDAVRMQQVLANLLGNAADASAGPILLRGRVLGDDRGYRIEVRDRGPGIAADRREQVFEPFFSERRGGSGLGLAVCRGIVDAHGGRIFVDPEVEVGAQIVVELPNARARP